MKLRCDLHVNGGARKLILATGPNEKDELLALKLAAYLFFWDRDPKMDASVKTPALAQYEFLPDLISLDAGGAIDLWLECGTATMHKLGKLIRRLPYGRIVVLKEDERGAKRLRADCEANLDKPARVEILAFPDGAFREWASCLAERTEVYGESTERMLNGVVNERPILIELKAF